MRRRDFINGIVGTMAAGPLAARAQQPVMPVVGFLRSVSLADAADLVAAFRQGLKEAGFIEGQNVAIEFRSAEGDPNRLPSLVAELISRPVAVIVGNSRAALAAKASTTTIPIVFAYGGDPVRDGLVASLNRPGGNVTGVNFFAGALGTKRLQLLRQLVPKGTTIAMLMNSGSPETEAERRDVQVAARTLGQELIILDVSSGRDIEAAFATFVQRGVGALLVGSGPIFFAKRAQILALVARHALPACYVQSEYVRAGGLMSYGASIPDAYRQAGIYVGRILKGDNPSNLPVMQATKFEFLLNLKAAKTLGLDVPPTLLATADEVIE
ncbi:MAG TPA: ABC transporter substrate-binding protein [Xanthobacteraceae bacterium]|nr:ABC transporter substrate-binding protein [Xanthobacteraceae bacterium]